MRSRNPVLVGSSLCVILVAIGWLALRATAQPALLPPDAAEGGAPLAFAPPPGTQLEALAMQKGVVVVKAYVSIGEIVGDDGSLLRVTAARFFDAAEPRSAATGALVEVREVGGRRAALSYVDAEEIPALINAIDTLARLQPGQTRAEEFEARYQSRGDLEIANAMMGAGRMAGVRCVQFVPLSGQLNWATAELRLARLPELAQLLDNARQALDRLDAPAEEAR